MIEQNIELPIIENNIQWRDIIDECKSDLLKVDHLTEFAVIENGKVKAMSPTTPYGIATVTCFGMNAQFSLWITHKIDFYNLKLALQYHENISEYKKLLNDRVQHFKANAGNKITQLIEIETWLQNAITPEILVGDFTSLAEQRRGWFTRLFESSLPKLYIWLCPEGYLQRLVQNNFTPLTGRLYFDIFRPLAKWEPEI
ncbi:MAG: hypothetical protein JW787_04230 [Sedimentisphaerales bacterium]|nr:hypothetical protein [Sedimentisphaerales bacterium]